MNVNNCLVIGAGNVAFRKINKLLKYNCNITVISKDILDGILNLYNSNKDKIKLIKREFNFNNDDDLKEIEKYFLIIAATNDKDLNNKISEYCIDKNILVNNISSKNNMNARFCTIIENQNYSIGISANGKVSDALKLKIEIEKLFNDIDIN
ncbi:NAD(P)-dependent oxidoreductase [Brachyspira intermedia]|uniref:precorrin-2 dehydrogenase/sirohydrochlorin ferrochelatase family protein n=1 Tax=Brachyspira intermedia TaxID=84377 RepID=UPI003005F326